MITVIGDVHGKLDNYLKIVNKSKYSIQVGDFGFESEWNQLFYSDIDPDKHKVLGGNHDDYDVCSFVHHYLGDYGVLRLDNQKIFFIRGALSVDKFYRETRGDKKSWWSQEELNYLQMQECKKLYCFSKPEIVISHAAPINIAQKLTVGTLERFGFDKNFVPNTDLFLQDLLDCHRPKIWIFGHYHRSFDKVIDGTRFVCLNELETFNL